MDCENRPFLSIFLLIHMKVHSKPMQRSPPASQRYLIKEMVKKQGVTEELKATDMMRWIGLMNNIRACADEIVVLNDIVYSNGYQPKKNFCQTDGSFFFFGKYSRSH